MTNLQLTRQSLRAMSRYQPDPDLRTDDAFVTYLFGSYTTVAIFERLLHWLPRGKRKDGSIYKSDKELAREMRLSTKTIERARKILKEAGFEIRVMKANGAPTNHYSFSLEKFLAFVAQKLHTRVENVRLWLEGKAEPKDEMESDKLAESVGQSSPDENPQLSLLQLDKLAESLTGFNNNFQTAGENTGSTTDTEDDVVVVSEPSLEKEIESLHLQLGTAHSDIRSWIEAFGLDKVKALAKHAVNDPYIDSKGGWVRFALRNNYQWTNNPQRDNRKANAESPKNLEGKSYTSGSKYADFIHY